MKNSPDDIMNFLKLLDSIGLIEIKRPEDIMKWLSLNFQMMEISDDKKKLEAKK